ncbi:MAG: TolC family protein [Desulfuromusa sp.]|nr:TolC family protein [Desulfuromusa sp.]
MKVRCYLKLLLRFCILLCLVLSTACVSSRQWNSYVDKPNETDVILPSSNALQFPALPKDATLQEPLVTDLSELSVEKAVILALQNNRDLQIQQQEPVIAGTFEQIERGLFDPEWFAEVDYFKERTEETSRSNSTNLDVKTDEVVAITGLRQLFPTGTSIEASLSQVRSNSNQETEQQQSRVGLSVTQSLLRGFGPAVNLVNIRQAEIDTLASIDELRGFSEALLADTEIAYWNYVLAKEKITIFEKSLAVARKQREEVELRIEVGLLPKIEAAATRAEEALRVQDLINARSLLEERRLRLLQRLNPNPDGQLDQRINVVSDPHLSPQPITDLSERLQLAEQSRADLHEARLRLQQRRLETIATRNGLLPRLDFFIALGKTGFDDSVAESFRAMDGKTYDFSAGLRLNYLLGNREARALNLASHISRQQALDAIANLRQIIHLDVHLAVNEVERNRQQIDASRASRVFQEQTLAAEKERFDVGTSTTLLVAQAQRDLLQTQISEIEAVVNYRIALVKLYLAEGSLLGRRGVQVFQENLAKID